MGAHSEQARVLTDIATSLVNEEELEAMEFADEASGGIKTTFTAPDGNVRVLKMASTEAGVPITNLEELMGFYDLDPDVWEAQDPSFQFWGSEKNPNFQVKAKFTRRPYQSLSAEDRDEYRTWASEHSPSFEDVTWTAPSGTGNLLEVFIPDLHVDRVGLNWFPEEARRRLMAAVEPHLARAQIDGLEQILFILGGDTFNRDHGDATTAGTPQEHGGNNAVIFRYVREMLVEALEMCATVAPTEVLIIPGNHDYEKSFYLADTLWSYFSQTDRVEVTIDIETRMYVRWGGVVLGFAHGKLEKPKDLPLQMFRETNCQGAIAMEWHLGHLHTNMRYDEFENQGVVVRRFRSPALNSQWEMEHGYAGNRKEITSILWSKERGKLAEYTAQF